MFTLCICGETIAVVPMRGGRVDDEGVFIPRGKFGSNDDSSPNAF